MCGIVGTYLFDRTNTPDKEMLRRIALTLRHRGPDDSGEYTAPGIGLGFRRLSIIDLSPAGHQPMTNFDSSSWIVFNGEFYNFKDHRKDLENQGAKFRSHTDTEVLLNLMDRFGIDGLKNVNGMFAFAYWNQQTQTLLVVRDRLGVKPLFYSITAQGLHFASEIKALKCFREIDFTMDEMALNDFLTFGYVPGPNTIFRGIKKLLPGSFIQCHDGNITVKEYWQPNLDVMAISELEAVEQLRALLVDAVKIRLTSDVPIGAFLSGGKDSSSVVALMKDAMSSPVPTFTIGFSINRYDEIPEAREFAYEIGCPHHAKTLNVPSIEELEQLVTHFDEPFADPSFLPTSLLSSFSREKVTVALTGDGGDELFGGYDVYQDEARETRMLRWVPDVARAPLSSMGRMLGRDSKLKRFLVRLAYSREARHSFHTPYFSPELKRELIASDFQERIDWQFVPHNQITYFNQTKGLPFLNRILYVDLKTWLADAFLPKVDRMTMLYSLEARSPFLDFRIVEFALRLPPNLKIRNGEKKYILNKVMRRLLPEKVFQRPKKGFSPPLEHWIGNEWREYIREKVFAPRFLQRGFFSKRFIQRLLQEFDEGAIGTHHQRNVAMKLWPLFVFETWCQHNGY